MKKTYKCSNIKFCMDDENQRRTWEYLQSLSRKDSAILKENVADIFEEMLDRVLEEKFHEMFPKLQEVLAEQISRGFNEYVPEYHSGMNVSADKADTDGMEQMQEAELSENMMAFAFAVGE